MPLVTTQKMFKKAYENGYAIGAFNVNNMEIIQGIVEAATEENAPLILQVSSGARKYANPVLPICLHLDHGDTFELCKSCIDGGFNSVMIDGSHHPFEENIKLTRQVVEYAHDHGVVVEGELGRLAGVEDDVKVKAEDSSYTRPEEVEEFVSKTGVDSLAIAIGTSHGAYKFKPGTKPQLRFDILEEVSRRLPGFPIVLHGASSVPARVPDRPSRRFFRSARVRQDHQRERRRAQRRDRRPRRYAPQSGVHGCLQDQHRLRPAYGVHRGHPQALRRASRPL